MCAHEHSGTSLRFCARARCRSRRPRPAFTLPFLYREENNSFCITKLYFHWYHCIGICIICLTTCNNSVINISLLPLQLALLLLLLFQDMTIASGHTVITAIFSILQIILFYDLGLCVCMLSWLRITFMITISYHPIQSQAFRGVRGNSYSVGFGKTL